MHHITSTPVISDQMHVIIYDEPQLC